MSYTIRKATFDDRGEIERLIAESVRGLSREDYTTRQIELSIKSVFGIDNELILDETYFVAESAAKKIVGCGGWSKRKTLYGASVYSSSRDSTELNPETDSAKIRAFFIHPRWARKGIGTAILERCEREARAHGFKSCEMMSTLPGVKLYSVCGYEGDERATISVGDNVEIECVRMKKRIDE